MVRYLPELTATEQETSPTNEISIKRPKVFIMESVCWIPPCFSSLSLLRLFLLQVHLNKSKGRQRGGESNRLLKKERNL